MKKEQVSRVVLYVMLALPAAWLIANLAFYFWGNRGVLSWQDAFLLRDNPLWAVILLILVSGLSWISAKRGWVKLLKQLESLKTLDRTTKTVVLLSAVFYISLFATALLFPMLTGYAFKSDWALLVVAISPLIALVLLLLVERASSVKAKFAGIEVEFHRTVTTPISQTVTLDRDLVAKENTYELRRIVEEIQTRQEVPQILVVRIGKRREQMRVDFLALRDYVYELSKVAPLEFIVFVDENNTYLGFMTVDKFKAKYPKYGIEVLLEDLERDERTYRWWERFFRIPFPEVREALDRVRYELVLPLWDSGRNRQEITERDLDRLGATRLYLQKPTVVEAYRRMVENNVAGIPVVDEERHFLGVANKDKVVQEVIVQLLDRT